MPAFFHAPRAELIAIGASTGGPDAIREVLRGLPKECPPVVIAQHMQGSFIEGFAARLSQQTRLAVVKAQGGERMQSGFAYIAPGHGHLCVKRLEQGFALEVSAHAAGSRYMPSVDVLFHSVAESAGAGALGVLLTGMGKDGAAGLLAMHRAGAWTIAQDQASCVVWGMPREAAMLGAAEEVAPLGEISQRLLARLGFISGPGLRASGP